MGIRTQTLLFLHSYIVRFNCKRSEWVHFFEPCHMDASTKTEMLPYIEEALNEILVSGYVEPPKGMSKSDILHYHPFTYNGKTYRVDYVMSTTGIIMYEIAGLIDLLNDGNTDIIVKPVFDG